MPVLINIVVVVLVWHYAGVYFHGLEGSWFHGSGWFWTSIKWVTHALLFIVRILATLATFVIVGNIAAVPFNDFLSERVDRIRLGWKDSRQFRLSEKAREILLVVWQEIKRLSWYLLIMLTLLILSIVPLFSPFTAFAQLVVTAVFFSVDYLSYPLERRGFLLLSQKFGFARAHMAASLGFGATMTLIALIPLVNFLFFPLGVVGGTLLFADLYRKHPELLEGARA